MRDAQGNPAQAQLTNTTLLLQQGKFVLNAPHMQLQNALADGKAHLGGFAFTVSDISLQVERDNGQTKQFLLTVQQPQVDVPLPIPGLLSQDGKGITVKADSLAVNQSGELQIKNGVATANCAAGAAATCGIQIDLASPLGFTLKTTQVKFSKPFDSSDTSVTGQFRLSNTQLLLPDVLPDADAPASGAAARIALAVQSESNGDWDPTHSPVAKITIPHDVNIGWNAVPEKSMTVIEGMYKPVKTFEDSSQRLWYSYELNGKTHWYVGVPVKGGICGAQLTVGKADQDATAKTIAMSVAAD